MTPAPMAAALTQADYLRHLHAESRRFRAVLADLDPGAPVPACPGWTAADLLWHLTEVHWFWAGMVRDRPRPPAEDRGYPDRPADREVVLGLFDAWSADLLDELTRADPAEPAWSWVVDETVGFTLRRQTHEALVHRIDAEQAAGTSSPVDPHLAADGVRECLGVLYCRVPAGVEPELTPHHARVDVTDTGDRLWARLGRLADGPLVLPVADPGTEPDLVVSGRAVDLDTWLWHRASEDAVVLSGDEGVRADLRAAVSRTI